MGGVATSIRRHQFFASGHRQTALQKAARFTGLSSVERIDNELMQPNRHPHSSWQSWRQQQQRSIANGSNSSHTPLQQKRMRRVSRDRRRCSDDFMHHAQTGGKGILFEPSTSGALSTEREESGGPLPRDNRATSDRNR
jgi:hypothetical protein